MNHKVRKFYAHKEEVEKYFDFWLAHNTTCIETSRIIRCIDENKKEYWVCKFTYDELKPTRLRREWFTLCEEKKLWSEMLSS